MWTLLYMWTSSRHLATRTPRWDRVLSQNRHNFKPIWIVVNSFQYQFYKSKPLFRIDIRRSIQLQSAVPVAYIGEEWPVSSHIFVRHWWNANFRISLVSRKLSWCYDTAWLSVHLDVLRRADWTQKHLILTGIKNCKGLMVNQNYNSLYSIDLVLSLFHPSSS